MMRPTPIETTSGVVLGHQGKGWKGSRYGYNQWSVSVRISRSTPILNQVVLTPYESQQTGLSSLLPVVNKGPTLEQCLENPGEEPFIVRNLSPQGSILLTTQSLSRLMAIVHVMVFFNGQAI